MSVWLLYLLLLKATVTSFSGLTSIPVIRNDLVVRSAVLTDQQLNAALAIGQTTPGPVGLYIVVIGYFAAGVPGAAAGMLALATPALLAIPLLRALRLGRTDVVSGAARGIVIAASVLTLGTAYGLSATAVPTIALAAIGLGALVLMATARMSPIWVVLLAGGVALIV